jgi:glutamyl-Q tRNA(Asp) synthetase
MVIGRFAPSPTGPLHFGSLVAALGSWLFARAAGGRWLVRMEDLDAQRVVPGCADDILRTLEALGLDWDGEVLFQSGRSAIYQTVLDRLIRDGNAYPCGCSRAEIARVSTAPHDGDTELVYPGTCRGGVPAGKEARAFRVRVGSIPVTFDDILLGRHEYDLSTTCGDFVLRRGDGLFAYQLAVVVDDAQQGVNQVVRGADLLSSTPRQIHLQRLLGLPTPAYAHLPLVTAPDGSKLSKRDCAVSLSLNSNAGKLLPAALSFLGQDLHPGLVHLPAREILAEALSRFSPSLIPRKAGPFAFSNANE